MKRSSFIILFMFTSIIYGQEYSLEMAMANLGSTINRWAGYESRWNPSKTIYEGDKNCLHDWCKKDIRSFSSISCAVLHDSRGCSNNWGQEEWICRKCLRDILVSEDRTIIPQKEKPKTEFEKLKERVNEKK